MATNFCPAASVCCFSMRCVSFELVTCTCGAVCVRCASLPAAKQGNAVRYVAWAVRVLHVLAGTGYNSFCT